MNRLEQKSALLVKLGALFGPLLKMVENPNQYNQQERAETSARYFHEFQILEAEFRAFCKGQSGHDYALEHNRFYWAVHGVLNDQKGGKLLESSLQEHFDSAKAAIDAVPVPPISEILEAGSPFTAYCRLRELCETDATTSLTWLDPYMSASIFHRYIACVRATVPVTLVTCETNPSSSGRDKSRWNEFLDVSRLYASERGTAKYTLVVQPNLHDRWAVFDEKRIYSLGGSVKDAALRDYFTITSVEATPTNLQGIKNHISGGAEFFGVKSPNHR